MADVAVSTRSVNWFWATVTKVLRWPAMALHALAKRVWPDFEKTFFGSDAFSRSTARYVWCANQFGHFALGVIAAAGIGHAVTSLSPWVPGLPSMPLVPVLVSGLIFLVLYLLKEVADGEIEMRGDALPFQLDEVELSLDSLTDTAFVALGVLAAVLWAFLAPNPGWLWAAVPAFILLALGGWCLWNGRRVLRCRDRLDASALPGFARLRRFNGRIEAHVFGMLAGTARSAKRRAGERCAEAARQVERFVSGDPGVLVISARDGSSGRTFLAIGVGCEFAERALPVRYLTWRSLKHGTFETEQEGALALVDAKVLILDGCTSPLSETVSTLRDRVASLPDYLVIVADGEHASDQRYREFQAECQSLHMMSRRAVLEVRIVSGLKVRGPSQRGSTPVRQAPPETYSEFGKIDQRAA